MVSTESQTQIEIDELNKTYWDELCGTNLAKSLGIEDDSAESLSKFDDWYFRLYPYLFRHIPFAQMVGKEVLEIGLGYGTVAERIARSGAVYHGLDIAAGPVAMATNRVRRVGAQADVKMGSILEPPFDASTFDWIVAIGVLHHTGDLQQAINQVAHLLQPGGHAIVMVYSALSYRQWFTNPVATLRRSMGDPAVYGDRVAVDGRTRGAYDHNAAGAAAPQTELVTASELKHMCRGFRRCRITRENIGAEGLLRYVPRSLACKLLGPVFGLDLYCRLEK